MVGCIPWAEKGLLGESSVQKGPSSFYVLEENLSMEYQHHVPSSRCTIEVRKHLGKTFSHRRDFPGEIGETISSWGQPKARATQLSSDQAEKISFALRHSSCSEEKPDVYPQILGACGAKCRQNF